MSLPRRVTPELLDSLPPDDPLAVGSRRDLARINALMGNARRIAGLLGSRPLGRLLEIGAGDGASTLRWARRWDRLGCHGYSPMPRAGDTRASADARVSPARSSARTPGTQGGRMTLLDRQSVVAPSAAAGLRGLGWEVETVSADVFDYLRGDEGGTYGAVVANLFLHHFEDDALRELLGLVAERTPLFVACEPERSPLGLVGTRLLGAIGCNVVTRHDARVSVLAGFADGELAALWPGGAEWRIEERRVLPFSHVFRAERAR